MHIRKKIAVGIAFVATAVAGLAALPLHAAAGSPQHGCFDDSRYPHSWTHGDPTVGVPSSSTGGSGYYYLNVFACGTSIEGAIWTSNGRWRIDIDDGYNHANPLARVISTTPFSLTYNGVHPGQFIRIRFANMSGSVHPDHATAYGSDACALVGAPSDTSAVSNSATCGPDPNTISNQFTAGPGSAPTSSGGGTSTPSSSPPSSSGGGTSTPAASGPPSSSPSNPGSTNRGRHHQHRHHRHPLGLSAHLL